MRVIKPVKNIREHKNLDEVLQRDLKDRKKAIAKYLLTDKSRFFNSITPFNRFAPKKTNILHSEYLKSIKTKNKNVLCGNFRTLCILYLGKLRKLL